MAAIGPLLPCRRRTPISTPRNCAVPRVCSSTNDLRRRMCLRRALRKATIDGRETSPTRKQGSVPCGASAHAFGRAASGHNQGGGLRTAWLRMLAESACANELRLAAIAESIATGGRVKNTRRVSLHFPAFPVDLFALSSRFPRDSRSTATAAALLGPRPHAGRAGTRPPSVAGCAYSMLDIVPWDTDDDGPHVGENRPPDLGAPRIGQARNISCCSATWCASSPRSQAARKGKKRRQTLAARPSIARFESFEPRMMLSYTPLQIQTAYGFNEIMYGSVKGNGAGQDGRDHRLWRRCQLRQQHGSAFPPQ